MMRSSNEWGFETPVKIFDLGNIQTTINGISPNVTSALQKTNQNWEKNEKNATFFNL